MSEEPDGPPQEEDIGAPEPAAAIEPEPSADAPETGTETAVEATEASEEQSPGESQPVVSASQEEPPEAEGGGSAEEADTQDNGRSGSGVNSPQIAESPGDAKEVSGSGASSPKRPASSQEELAKQVVQKVVKKVASQDQVKPSGSAVSDKKPPSGASSRSSVKKTPGQAKGDSPKQAPSVSGSLKKADSKSSQPAEPAPDGGERSASAHTGGTVGLLRFCFYLCLLWVFNLR